MEKILACPLCKSPISIEHNKLTCSQCNTTYIYKDSIFRLIPSSLDSFINESKDVWDRLYETSKTDRKLAKLHEKIAQYELPMLNNIIHKKGRSLEIGCGISMMNMELAKKKWEAWGVDFSHSNLVGAVNYWKKHKVKGYFVEGNILNLPFINNSFDLVFGRGVLEHFTDTSEVVRELYRVTKKQGFVVNTVPALTLSSLTYRQLSGTIPEYPILRPLFEFIHINLFNKRFMHCGYEKSFTKNYLYKIHKEAGFKNVKVSRFEEFEGIYEGVPYIIKNLFNRLEKHSLFIPWYKVVAQK